MFLQWCRWWTGGWKDVPRKAADPQRRTAMSDQEQDLRATEEDIAADSTRLADIEREKAGLEPDDPRLTQLSAEGERLARRIVPKTVAERDIADEVASPQKPG